MKSTLNKFLFTLHNCDFMSVDYQLLFSPSSQPMATILLLSNFMGLIILDTSYE